MISGMTRLANDYPGSSQAVIMMDYDAVHSLQNVRLIETGDRYPTVVLAPVRPVTSSGFWTLEVQILASAPGGHLEPTSLGGFSGSNDVHQHS